MANYRFMVLAVALMFASFAMVEWLMIPRQLMPNAKIPSFHRIGTSDDPRENYDPNASDNDEVRDKLRRAALTAANNLLDNPCNDYMRDQYIAAATDYARAWLSIAPCFGHCMSAKESAQLQLAHDAFATPLDDRVTEAMVRVHETDTIRHGDFAPDVERWEAGRSRDILLNPAASPDARKSARERRPELGCRPHKT